MGIFTLFIALFVGFGLSFMLVGFLLSKSNNHGDSKAEYMDFTREPLQILVSNDNIKRPG